VSALRGCSLIVPFLKIFNCVCFLSSPENDDVDYVVWANMLVIFGDNCVIVGM